MEYQAVDIVKPRPTEAEFDELKRQRDEAIDKSITAICEEQGWDKAKVGLHVSGAGNCYCACPEGPCQHLWNGPDYAEEGMVSVTCSRCGTPAIYHDMRCGP